MKPSHNVQISIEVAKAIINSLPYKQYALSAHINEQSVDTSFKLIDNSTVDFSTRLFLHLEPTQLEKNPNCIITARAITQSGTRIKIAEKEIFVSTKQPQQIDLVMIERDEQKMAVSLRVSTSLVQPKQPKTITNKLPSYKNNISQKQSACSQKQSLLNKSSLIEQTSVKHKDNEKSMIVPKNFPSQKVLKDEKSTCEDLQRSAATTKESAKAKQDQSNNIISYQLKIDELQDRIKEIKAALQMSNQKLIQTEKILQMQQKISKKLAIEKQQLIQLLVLQQEKNNILSQHINKVLSIVEKNSSGHGIQLISQQEQILLMNQQLEAELINKTMIIAQMTNTINQLQTKIQLLQAKQVAPKKGQTLDQIKTNHLAQLGEKTKSAQFIQNSQEKRLSEKNTIKKKNEQVTTLKISKIKQPQKSQKTQTTAKIPIVPKNTKSPPVKIETAVMKSPKAATKLKTEKNQQKPTIDKGKRKIQQKPAVDKRKIQQKPSAQKDRRSQRSHISGRGSIAQSSQTFLEPSNLMMNSRATNEQYSIISKKS